MLGTFLAVLALPGYAGGDVFDMILRASAFSKVILFVLFAFSVASWAIIFERWWFIRGEERRSSAFLQNLRRAESPSSLRRATRTRLDNPFARVFEKAMSQLEGNPGPEADPLSATLDKPAAARRAVSTESLQRSMEQAIIDEIAVLERNLGFLATTGSTCPFIGLLGTVWGVMSAFMSMGREGSASLAVVAPGIAEALIVTAAGLFAAIPAVIGYNLFVNRVQQFGRRMDSFSLEILNRLER